MPLGGRKVKLIQLSSPYLAMLLRTKVRWSEVKPFVRPPTCLGSFRLRNLASVACNQGSGIPFQRLFPPGCVSWHSAWLPWRQVPLRTKEGAGSCFLLVLPMRIFRPWRLRCPTLHLPSFPTFSIKCSLPSLPTDEDMCKSVTTGEWKKVFYEKMEEVKPADSWDFIIDPNLKHNVLAPGWKQYLELHASGR